MPRAVTNSKTAIFFLNQSQVQGHKDIGIGVIQKGFISRVCMPNMTSLYILYGSNVITMVNTQTGQKRDYPEFHYGT